MSKIQIARGCLFVLIFLLPFWFLPLAGFSLGASKSLLFYTLVLASIVFYLLHLLQEKKFPVPKNLIMIAVGSLLLVAFVSCLFSGQMGFSMFGNGGEVTTFSFLLFLVLVFFLSMQLFQNEKHVLLSLFLVVVSSLILLILQSLHSFFGLSFGNVFVNKLDGFLGLWSELGIFFGFIALMITILLEFLSAHSNKVNLRGVWRFLLYAVLFVSLVVMAFVNFTYAWIIFGSSILIFFVYLFSHSGVKSFVRPSLFLLLVSLFFILSRPMVGDFVNSLGLDFFEVRPSFSATVQVVKSTLNDGVKNLLIGSGPNTFVYDWLKFKPSNINQTLFWATRFDGGVGFLPSMVATVGLLGILSFLFFLVVFLYNGFKSINFSLNESTKTLIFASFLGTLYFWIFNVIYVPSHVLLILSFFMAGLFFGLLIKAGKVKVGEISIVKSNSSFAFVSVLLIIFLLMGSVSAFYLVFQKYWANYSFAKGLILFGEKGDLDEAESYFSRAVRFDKQDQYFRTLSEVGLLRISNLINQQGDLSQEEVLSRFQDLLSFTVQNAQNAIEANPADFLNWMSLGQVYENLVPLQIEGARLAALNAYGKASEYAPLDPRPFLASARVETQSNNLSEAKSFLQSSLNFKSNYTPALFLLARLTAQEGDLDSAINQTEIARLTAPNDVGILFQLGMLYYQKEDYKKAQLSLERAVAISSSYSNARYFLGLSYDKLGMKAKAVEQFEIIKQYNPGNEEVERILTNLGEGRPALSEISPPEPAPEEREELPIEELEE